MKSITIGTREGRSPILQNFRAVIVGSFRSNAFSQSTPFIMTMEFCVFLSRSCNTLSTKQTSRCSVPVPFCPPYCFGSILCDISSSIQPLRIPSYNLLKSDVLAIFRTSDSCLQGVTLGTGETVSIFQRAGKRCSVRQVLMIYVRGSDSSTETSFLSLLGRSIGRVLLVFFNFINLLYTWSWVTWGGGEAGQEGR